LYFKVNIVKGKLAQKKVDNKKLDHKILNFFIPVLLSHLEKEGNLFCCGKLGHHAYPV